jgi:hypothetical protein
MATYDEWAARYRAKFAPYEVPTEERERVITEGEVGQYPGDSPEPYLKSGRKEFEQLATERLALSGQVRKAREKEKELHPHPKLERFFDRTIGRVPSFLSPDVPTPETAFQPVVKAPQSQKPLPRFSDQRQEAQFQDWYKQNFASRGINPNPDDPLHYYDYRKAFQEGMQLTPDPSDLDERGRPRLHGDSKYKLPGHPREYLETPQGRLHTPTGKVTPGSRFQVEDGEIIDTKHREIISQDRFNAMATPQERAMLNGQLGGSAVAAPDDGFVLDVPEVHVVGERITQAPVTAPSQKPLIFTDKQGNVTRTVQPPKPKTSIESDIKELGRQVAAGAVVDLPKMGGQALQAFSPKDTIVNKYGKELAADAKLREAGWQPDLDGRGDIAGAFIRGGRAIAPSLSTMAAYLNPYGAVTGPLATVALFGGSQYTETHDKVKEAGGSDDDARNAGLIAGAIQGGGEVVSNWLALRMFGAGKNLATQQMQRLLGETTSPAVVKPWLKSTASAFAGEPATEIAQDVGTAITERSYGVKTAPLELIAKESGSAALGMTALLSPFGLHGHYRQAKRANAIDHLLTDPNAASPEERAQVVQMLHDEGVTAKIPDADRWLAGALQDVAEGKPVRRTAVSPVVTPEEAIAPPPPKKPVAVESPFAGEAEKPPLTPAEQVGRLQRFDELIRKQVAPLGGLPPELSIRQQAPFLMKRPQPMTPEEVTPEPAPVTNELAPEQPLPPAPELEPLPATTVPSQRDLAPEPEAAHLPGSELANLGQAGQAVVDNMYQMMFDKVRAGDTTEGGKSSAALQAAKLVYDAGGITSVEDMRAFGADIQRALHSGLKGHARQSLIRSVVAEWMPQAEPVTPPIEHPSSLPSDPLTNDMREAMDAPLDEQSDKTVGSPIDPGPALETIDKMYRTILDDTKSTHHMKREQKDAWQVVKRVDQVMKAGLADGLEYEQAVQRVDPADLQALAQIMQKPEATPTAVPTPDTALDAQAHEAATSPVNQLPEPSEAQKESGNYKKGHVRIAGLNIAIENPQGSIRSGTDKSGKPWSREMQSHYGYIKGTKGKDKDHVDVFVKPGTPEDYDGSVYVIDQQKSNRQFDEHKIVLGAESSSEARKIYSDNYPKDWKGLSGLRILSMKEFKRWVRNPEATKNPVMSYNIPKEVEDTAKTIPAPDDITSPMVQQPRSELPIADNMEMQLRAEKAEADIAMASDQGGTTLMDFLRSKGGVQNQGSELSHLGIDSDAKRFVRKFIQKNGMTLDQAAEAAHEAGYIPERDIATLLKAIEDEHEGRGQDAEWLQSLIRGSKPMTRGQINEAIQKIIKDHGVDVGKAVERVKAALLKDREFSGSRWGEDADAIARGEWPSWMEKPGQTEEPPTPEMVLTAPQPGLPSKKKANDTPKAEQVSTDVATPDFALSKDGSTEKVSASDKSVRDHGQRASIDGGIITVSAYVGSRKAESYTIPLEEWRKADRGPSANPNWNRRKLIEKYTKHYDDQPGGEAQADQIRDSQIRAIQKASEQLPVPAKQPATPPDAFALTSHEVKQPKPKAEDQQTSIPVPAEVIGSRPIIGREVTPEEAPIFSKAAQTPDAEQTTIEEQPDLDIDRIQQVAASFGKSGNAQGRGHATEILDAIRILKTGDREGAINRLKQVQTGSYQQFPALSDVIGDIIDGEQQTPRSEYPDVQGRMVDGLYGLGDTPNQDSIAATLDDYKILKGIKEVPLSDFESAPKDLFYAADDIKRTKALAEQIEQSGEVKPLIVVTKKGEKPYILEGAHRLGALHILGKKSFPAMVVEDLSADEPAPAVTKQESKVPTPDTIEYTVQSLRPGATPETLTLPKEPAKQSDDAKAQAETGEDWSEDGSSKVASFIARRLEQGGTISLADVTARADDSFGGTQAEGKYTPKDAFDGIELGVNRYLMASTLMALKPNGSMTGARDTVDWIRTNILDRLPTPQNRRTEEQDEFQQFSTPPDLAYVMNWAAKLTDKDVVLEPSAGLGGLAVFAKNSGATVVLNEYSERRANLLRSLDLGTVYIENAEQLHNILPKEIKPTVVIMNPPFTSTAGRVQGERKTSNMFLHLDQALKRLEPGGRLVALIGKGMMYKDPRILEDWLTDRAKQYAYRARIGLSGEGFKKYGTTYDNQILIFDKVSPDNKAPVIADFADVRDALPLLKEVRDARHDTGIAPHELRPAESARQEVPTPGETDARPRQSVPAPARTVGARPDQTEKRPLAERPPAVVGQSPDVESRGRADVPPRQPRRSPQSAVDEAAPAASDVGTASRPSDSQRAGSADERRSKPRLPSDKVQDQLEVSSEQAPSHKGEALTDSVYESYSPRKVKIPGAKKHPGKLVESAALSAVDPPNATYRPHLPKSVVEKGLLSDVQLEAVVYAGQAHEQLLPGGERRGFFLGDGPGVGKGRAIAGIIRDNWQQGRTKTVWFSETQNLGNSAVRDWEALGGKPSDIVNLNKFTREQKIERPTGILYTTYTTIASGLDVLAGGNLKAKQAKGKEQGVTVKTRLDQVLDWLGPDFDGLIVFDEAHNMANSLVQEGERGDTKPAAKALASITLQARLPKARIVYSSATAASRVDGLAYADRLGLWGEGTPFPSKSDFIQSIEASGLGAMEIVAQNMKSMGGYISRNLDYSDVRYRKVEHALTEVQREIYDEMANAWQLVLNNVEQALAATGVASPGKKANAAAKSAAYSKFWGANQRFFNQVLTSMQMPSVVKDMKAQLERDRSLLVQLVNTNEAIMDRQLQQADQSGADIESLDMTPRQNLMQYVEKAFPTAQFEEYTDEQGNKRTRMVTDSKGVPVQNAEAVVMRDALLEKLGALRVPEGPLEIILNTFGPGMVAEVTGRSERIVRLKNEDDGTETVQRQKRSPSAVRDDVTAFMGGKKRILVFSDKGGTGESYHADRTKKNQQQRVHYLIQPGWRADKAVQGLGRSHRTNQASAPEYALTMTDIKGHKRFISTIARRLNQLGALTKGQRQAGSSGLIDAKDNLENGYAVSSVKSFFRDLFRNQVEGFAFQEVTKKLGLTNLVDKDGALIEERIPTVPQFLNRLLSVDLAYQNRLFDQFTNRLDRAVEYAAAQGTLDVGMETYRADGGIQALEKETVYEDPQTKAKVELIQLEAKHSVELLPSEQVEKKKDFKRYVRNTNSGKVWAVLYDHMQTKESGAVVKTSMLQSPKTDRYQYVEVSDLKRLYSDLDKTEGRKAWETQLEQEPTHTTERFYMATGSILNIWDRLPKDYAKIRRLQTTDGERYLGRILNEAQASHLEVKLGKGQKKAPTLTPAQSFDAVLDDGDTLTLANDWKIKRVRVNNEPRIEVVGDDVYRSADQLKGYGAFSERIQFATRYFIPTDKTLGERVLEKIVKFKPIVDVIKKGMAILKEERGSIPANPLAKSGAGSQWDVEAYRQQRAQQDLIGFQSADQEIEARVREAKKGLQPETLPAKLKAHTERLWRLFSREFEHLPDTAEFSILRTGLLQLQKYKGIAADKIQRDLAGIIKPLSRKQYDQLEWKTLLSDLQREAEHGHLLPFGYTPEKVEADLTRLDDVIARDPKVQEAWEKRQGLWDRIKTEYKQSMDAIGFDVSKKLTKQDYFRHQVLEHARQGTVSGTGARVRTPTGRGFLKTRKGSTYDINANYVQAEFEVMAQMVYDTQLAKVIGNVDRHYNIRKSLEQQAKQLNRQALQDLMADEDAGPLIESQMKEFKKRMGMHMSMLKRALELEKDDEVSMAQVAAIADDLESPGRANALGFLKATNERKAYIKALLGPDFKTWEDLVPETHEVWQPREGNVFYMVDSIPAYLTKALQEGMLDEAGFPVDKLRKVLAQGGAREEYVIPKEAAATLDNLSKPQPSWFVEMNRQLLGHWKQLMLIAPRKVFRYNVRNLTGDADALFVGNPSAFKKLPQAARELIPVIFKDDQLTGEAKHWAERGGYGTTLQFQELGDINDLKAFVKTLDRADQGGWMKAPLSAWNTYWKTARLATDYREAMMRYAAYLDYLGQMQANNGRPKNFGASRPETVMALPDIRDRAFKLSNELLGAYDRVSVAGQTIRNFWIPFYSWMEVNASRYFRLTKNALDGGHGGSLARGALVTGKQAAGFLIRLSAFWGMLQAWNYLMFGDDEDELRDANPTVANRPHILFGRDENGKIQYLSGVGALGDLLSWFGLDAFPGLIGDIMHDRLTIGEAIKNATKAPVNRIWQGLTPAVKIPLELAVRESTYPDVFNPRPINDRGDYLGQQTTFGPEIAALRDKPGKPLYGVEDFTGLLVQRSDPKSAAYGTWNGIEKKYLERMGKDSTAVFWRSPKGEALSNWSRAIADKDTEAQTRWQAEYERIEKEKYGTKFTRAKMYTDMERSLRAKAPLAGVTKAERAAIVKQLDAKETRALKKAEQYYRDVIMQVLPAERRGRFEHRLEQQGWLTHEYDVLTPEMVY